jgi:DNA invertase Pin-like site-specific DNA recombinase
MNSTQPLKVLGYLRVSTNKQDIGPEVQRAALEAEARRHGWELTIRREDAASATSLKNRPVLASALADLKAGTFDALAVSKLDRLSRSVSDFAGMLETSNRQRWALICLDLGIDTSTITGAAMAQVTCAFAEMEAKKIAERTRAGMAELKAKAAAKGEYKHMGRRSVLPEATVRQILSERDNGASLARIARSLNEGAVPTATGGKWYASTVRQVLGSATADKLGRGAGL